MVVQIVAQAQRNAFGGACRQAPAVESEAAFQQRQPDEAQTYQQQWKFRAPLTQNVIHEEAQQEIRGRLGSGRQPHAGRSAKI